MSLGEQGEAEEVMDSAPIVFPVRFVSQGQAVQSTSRELWREEIAVRCLKPPAVGARLSMALYLPGLLRPEIAVGEVKESIADGRFAADSGFRARFLALDPEARRRIDLLLEDHLQRGPPAERISEPEPEPEEPRSGVGVRLFPRFPVRFKVRFSDPLEFITQYADNISRGGLFIETLDPPDLGRAVAVILELPDGGPPISASALVVHRVPFAAVLPPGESPGCGVQFLDTSDGFHERIESYLVALAIAPAGDGR
jgi:type IV pilus assembly protein PilZ